MKPSREDDSLVCRLLSGDDLAVGAKPIARVRFGGPLLLRFDGGGNERQRDELAVQMGD